MAIGSICEHCEAGFSAPDASIGTNVTCPTCGKNTRVLGDDEIREVEERRKQDQRRQEDYRSRIALLEDLEEQQRVEGLRGDFESSFRYFQPRAGSRNRRLRLLSSLLLVLSWVILVLGVCSSIAANSFLSGSGSFLLILLISTATIFCFAVLRFLSEASQAFADVADRQWDIRALLLDIFEGQERQQEAE